MTTEHHEEPLEQNDDIIGVAFKWSIGVIIVIAALAAAVTFFNRESEEKPVVIERPPVQAPDSLDQSTDAMPGVVFTDITQSAGIRFNRFDGGVGEKLLPETMGGGGAFFDLDNDGDQDLVLINGTDWPHEIPTRPRTTAALYRNDGQGNFTDVTVGSGLDFSIQGMGVACGDFDGDGWTDLYISAVGPNRLLRNENGRFRDVTDEAGVAGAPDDWTTSAGFFDFDRDGDLDLFACNYIGWSRDIDLQLNFTLNGSDRAFGPPTQYVGASSMLFENRGDGTFTDVSEAKGIAVRNPATGEPMGKALAVTFADPDNDGWLDILVANDTVQNFVFRNLEGQSFEEIGSASGMAFDSMGNATGAMGMDAARVYADDRLSVAIANFANESSSFYVQQPANPWRFADMAGSEGIGSPSRLKLSFGLFFFDFDLDGRLDLLQTNGHLEEEITSIQASQSYRQAAQLFWNCGPQGRACYAMVPENSTGDLAQPIVGRGSSYADIDGDGDLDVLLMQASGPALLLRNDQQLNNHWIRLRLKAANGNTEAIGARVQVQTDGRTMTQTVMPTRSYLSQVESVLTFGLGEATTIDSVKITWPDGTTQELTNLAIDQSHEITQQPAR